jgi:hypothetical protein
VATIRFTAVASGTAAIGGEVVKIKDATTTVALVDVLAGAGTVAVTASRRVLLGSDERALEDQAIKSLVAALHGKSRPKVGGLLTNHNASSAPPSAGRAAAKRGAWEERRRLDECSTVLGDTNGDCTFDVEDVQYLQYYINGKNS